MENHVSGQVTASAETPNPLAALRQSILAVVVGNPHFTPEEQLRANHTIHECEQLTRITRWLRNVQREAARRELVAHAQELAGQWSPLADDATLEAEMQRVERYSGLDAFVRRDLRWLFNDATTQARRLTIVGAAYKMVLRHLDRLDEVLN